MVLTLMPTATPLTSAFLLCLVHRTPAGVANTPEDWNDTTLAVLSGLAGSKIFYFDSGASTCLSMAHLDFFNLHEIPDHGICMLMGVLFMQRALARSRTRATPLRVCPLGPEISASKMQTFGPRKCNLGRTCNVMSQQITLCDTRDTPVWCLLRYPCQVLMLDSGIKQPSTQSTVLNTIFATMFQRMRPSPTQAPIIYHIWVTKNAK